VAVPRFHILYQIFQSIISQFVDMFYSIFNNKYRHKDIVFIGHFSDTNPGQSCMRGPNVSYAIVLLRFRKTALDWHFKNPFLPTLHNIM